jgi:hypothetical protein
MTNLKRRFRMLAKSLLHHYIRNRVIIRTRYVVAAPSARRQLLPPRDTQLAELDASSDAGRERIPTVQQRPMRSVL